MNIIEAAKALNAGRQVFIDEDGSGFGKSFAIGMRYKGRNSYLVYDDDSQYLPLISDLLSEKWTVVDE